MTDAVFASYLVVALAGLAACLAHAWPDREHLALLVTLTGYGVVLEQLVILRFERYVYSVEDYLLVLGDVPLVIGFGWGAIIYSGLALSASMGVPARVRPAVVGLYALHLDLTIDAVAIRIPFWSWTPPGVWFGVPLGNFVGWLLVSTLFAAAWLGVRERVGPPLLAGLAAALLALVGLVVGLEAWEAVATTEAREAVVLGGAVLALVVVVVRARPSWPAPEPLVAVVPLLYHGAYLTYLLALALAPGRPGVLLVSLTMLVLTLVVHAPALRRVAGRVLAVGRRAPG